MLFNKFSLFRLLILFFLFFPSVHPVVQTDMSGNSSLDLQLDDCKYSRTSHSVYAAICISYTFLLPLFIFVLYVGYQRWRKQRSAATAAMSHSDIITYHMAVLEIISVVGYLFYYCGAYTQTNSVMWVGKFIFFFSSTGQTLFHLLTCVERYLAVVHPVTYLGLRQGGGVRIRNVSIGCVWLLSFCTQAFSPRGISGDVILNFTYLILSTVIVSFCSIYVLCVLIRPGPGEVGGHRQCVDQSKQRAFHTIMVILGALLMRFLCIITFITLYYTKVIRDSFTCLIGMLVAWFCLPSSLVLPLLFLHRTRILSCFKSA